MYPFFFLLIIETNIAKNWYVARDMPFPAVPTQFWFIPIERNYNLCFSMFFWKSYWPISRRSSGDASHSSIPGVARLARLAQVLEAALRSVVSARHSVADDGDFRFHVGFMLDFLLFMLFYSVKDGITIECCEFSLCVHMSCCGDVMEIFLRFYGLYGVISTSSSKDEWVHRRPNRKGREAGETATSGQGWRISALAPRKNGKSDIT